MTELPATESGPASLTSRKLGVWILIMTAAMIVVLGVCSLFDIAPLTADTWQLTVRRLIAAAIVGAALASGGVALQGLLRNPLAEPFILGISSGAGVGVLAGMALSQRGALPQWAAAPLLAFAGALVTCVVVFLLAQRRGRMDPYSLILSGVIINAFNGAIMLIMHLYIDSYRIADFARWSMGGVYEATGMTLLLVCGACVLLGWAVLLVRSSALNALGMGDEVAASMGVSVRWLKIQIFAFVALMAAAAVALAGPIGFVGLIIPHMCRMAVGCDHRLLTVISAFVGAMFLMTADTVCAVGGPWIGVGVIPVGIITTLAGGPFFLYLLNKRMRETPA